METKTNPKEANKKATGFNILKSTNGVLNIIILLVFAAGAYFGIGEDPITTLIAAAAPIVGFIREIVKGERVGQWTGNIITYIISAILIFAPWLGDLLPLLQPVVEAITSGNINSIWGLFIPIINEILLLIRTKPWQNNNGTIVAG